MDISALRLTVPLPITEAETRTRLAWQAGDILEATVVVSTVGQLTLEIGGIRLQAQSDLQFSTGQHLRMQVTDSGELPVLRLLANTPDSNLAVQSRALRMAFPQQASLAPVIQGLMRFIQSNPKTERGSRASLFALAAEILHRLPRASDLGHPEGLKQAIQECGLFLEARLARLPQGASPTPDLKADLLRLEAAVQAAVLLSDDQASAVIQNDLPASFEHRDDSSAPFGLDKNFLQAVRGALARLEVNQISLSEGRMLALELPIRRGDRLDTFSFVLEESDESSHGHNGAQRPWTATLRFDLEGLGPVWTRVAVTGEVSVFFQTEWKEASRILSSRLDELRTGLINAGLIPGRLTAQSGPLPALPCRLPSVPLLDERA
ncbi:conserved hypothetical protein [Gammaproteobacteria bacterium]